MFKSNRWDSAFHQDKSKLWCSCHTISMVGPLLSYHLQENKKCAFGFVLLRMTTHHGYCSPDGLTIAVHFFPNQLCTLYTKASNTRHVHILPNVQIGVNDKPIYMSKLVLCVYREHINNWQLDVCSECYWMNAHVHTTQAHYPHAFWAKCGSAHKRKWRWLHHIQCSYHNAHTTSVYLIANTSKWDCIRKPGGKATDWWTTTSHASLFAASAWV